MNKLTLTFTAKKTLNWDFIITVLNLVENYVKTQAVVKSESEKEAKYCFKFEKNGDHLYGDALIDMFAYIKCNDTALKFVYVDNAWGYITTNE